MTHTLTDTRRVESAGGAAQWRIGRLGVRRVPSDGGGTVVMTRKE